MLYVAGYDAKRTILIMQSGKRYFNNHRTPVTNSFIISGLKDRGS